MGPSEDTSQLPAPTAAAGYGPAISVIVAADTYRAVHRVYLDAFLEQSADPNAFELIVVDWEGDPRLGAQVERLRACSPAPRVVYLRSAARGRAAMNNRGVAGARAPLLCFCADDFIPRGAFVESHLAYHAAHPELTRVAIGPAASPPEMRRASPILAWLEDTGELFGAPLRDLARPLPPAFFYVANASLKRALYDQAGPFDERFPFPAYDDMEYGHRLAKLGMISELVPNAGCIHDHLVRLADRRAQLRWAGASAAILSLPTVDAGERRRHLARLHIGALRDWLRSSRRDGPRIAWWRWSLTVAFLAAYRREMRSRHAG